MRKEHAQLFVLSGLVALLLFLTRGYIMQLSRAGRAYIAGKEGFSETPYNDPPGSGKFSIGYGHQILPGENLVKVTRVQADDLLAKDTAKANAAVSTHVTAPLTQAQHDALVSFVYNVGVGAFASGTVPAKLNSGDFRSAAETMRRYNKVRVDDKLVVNAALTQRRDEEARVFDV